MTSISPAKRSRFTAILLIITLFIGLAAGYLLGHHAQAPTTTTGMPVTGVSRPDMIPRVEGWLRGADVSYLDYGSSLNVAVPILAFFQASSPDTPVQGQRNVIDTIPGRPGYSDFWRVYKVLVPSSYTPNTIRSFDEALASGYTIQLTDIVVNCPVVNPNTTIQGSSAKPVLGWYRNRDVHYFDHGSRSPSAGSVVQYAPIYSFVWKNGSAVAGQRNVIDIGPGETGYSDLWRVVRVIVPDSYVPNTLNDTLFIFAQSNTGTITLEATNIFVNCPVVP